MKRTDLLTLFAGSRHRFVTAIVVACLPWCLLLVSCGGSAKMYDSSPSYAAEAGGMAMPSPAPPPAPGGDMSDSWGGDDELDAMMDVTEAEPETTTVAAGKRSSKMKKSGDDKQAGAANKDANKAPEKRLIIYVANLGIFAFEVDKTLETIAGRTKELGGWVQQSTSSSLTLRVPVAEFEKLVADIEGMGDVHQKNVVGTDVTEEFFDLSIRLNNAMVLRQRYIQLLAKATKVEESLMIEKELSRLTGEIERFKGRIKFLKAHAAHSTITVSVQSKPDTPVETRRVPLPFHWLQNYSLDNIFY